MPPADSVQRVRIYLSRDDQWEGAPRYLALLDELRQAGATGATALQGLAGFGPGQRSRPGRSERPDQRQPVVVEWIDRVERIARILPSLDALLGDALVTVEEIPVYRAVLRARGPFGADLAVGDLMRRPAPALAPDTPLAQAIARLRSERLDALPVADAAGRLVGLLSEQELRWRAGLRLSLHALHALAPSERDAALAPLIGRSASSVMSPEPRSIGSGASVAQAVVVLVEWGYTQLPVVDRDGTLVGLLGFDEVLRAAISGAAPDETAVRDAEPPPTARLLMQAAVGPLGNGQTLAQALARFAAAPERPLLIVDPAGRLLGTLDLADALAALQPDERAAFLAALQRGGTSAGAGLPGADRTLDALTITTQPTIAPEATLLDAARQLLELQAEQIAVVDSSETLLGIIARGGIVRALMQQSGA